MFRISTPILVFILLAGLFFGCATYYRKTLQFQEYLVSGQFDKADQWMETKSKDRKGKNLVLYYLNRGYLNFMLKQYDQSNQFFQSADRLIEDYIKKAGNEVLSLITNPMIKPYRVEDFENIMLNYFTALNFSFSGMRESAIVECKRINIKLNQLNDKYKDKKNRYQKDAFGHLLMGILYEQAKDYNNAFIAYRNAYDIYEKDYKGQFNIKAPDQLKNDLLRTAYLTGFHDEVEFYERQFNLKFDKKNIPESELILFWMNGFGPIKKEWSINFTNTGNNNGWITLVNDEFALNFPFYVGNMSSSEQSAFGQLRFMRVAFPKYVERKPVFVSATLTNGKNSKALEEIQNINDIAFKTLHDRMLREMGNSLLRLATKKALEQVASKQNANLGTAVSIVNALSEKADTRNWQTLPYSISYVRIPLEKGSNSLTLQVKGRDGRTSTQTFKFEGQKGKIHLHSYHNLESYPPVTQ